jgi:hypothetical protein
LISIKIKNLFRGGTFPTYNPANGELIAEVANGTADDIDLAIKASKRCLYSEEWGYVQDFKGIEIFGCLELYILTYVVMHPLVSRELLFFAN